MKRTVTVWGLLVTSVMSSSAALAAAEGAAMLATTLSWPYHWMSSLPMSQNATNEPASTWQEQRDALTDDSLPYSPRYRALYLACTSTEEESAQAILNVIGAWLSELEATGIKTIRTNTALVDKRNLVGAFLPVCASPIEKVLKDQRPLLRLLERITVSNVLPGSGIESFQAIAKNPAPLEVRREFLLSIIAQRRPFSFNDSLYPLFDPSTFPRLREIVRTPPEPGKLNHLAVQILAHYGDREILPELRTWHTRLLEQSPKQAYRAEVAIWKIEVQEPPSKLLDYVATPGGWVARDWAVRRAAELGTSKHDIREAILTYAREGAPNGRARAPGLIELKRAGLELGILQEDDLPDVVVRSTGPTP